MDAQRYTSGLVLGQEYDRPALSRIWKLGGHQAISRGVFTPSGSKCLFLFVTREKQTCLTQYQDFLDGDLLFWEGESGHGADARIAQASANGDEIHLFYRQRHHQLFTYHGRVILAHWIRHEERPSQFTFKIVALAAECDESERTQRVAEEGVDYEVASAQALSNVDKKVLTSTRGIAQHIFRGNLLKMWDGACAVTGVRDHRVLRASHIKPWRQSSLDEKLDRHNGLLLVPDLDTLFDQGLISFRRDGSMLRSDNFHQDDQSRMRIDPSFHLREVHPEMEPYLAYHRDVRFIA